MASTISDFTVATTQTDNYLTGSKDVTCNGYYRRFLSDIDTTDRIIWRTYEITESTYIHDDFAYQQLTSTVIYTRIKNSGSNQLTVRIKTAEGVALAFGVEAGCLFQHYGGNNTLGDVDTGDAAIWIAVGATSSTTDADIFIGFYQ